MRINKTKIMVKNFALLILVIGLFNFSSCTEKNTTPAPAVVDNHINFTLDGTKTKAKFKVLLQDEVFNAYYTAAKSIDMQRLVVNGSPEGLIFKIDRISLDKATLPITIKYSVNQDKPSLKVTYVSPDNMPFGTNISNPDDFSLTINSYSSKVINCTFSGVLYSGNSNRPKVDITDGALNLELLEI